MSPACRARTLALSALRLGPESRVLGPLAVHTAGQTRIAGHHSEGGHDTARPTPAATQVLASVGRGPRRVVFESMSAERLLCERGVGQN